MPRQGARALGKLQDSLVLFKYMLSLFGTKDLSAFTNNLKDPALEGLNEEGESFFYHALVFAYNIVFKDRYL